MFASMRMSREDTDTRDGGNDAASRDQVSGGDVLACRMGYYYRCRIQPLDDEAANIASDAIVLSSALKHVAQKCAPVLRQRHA